MPRIFEKDIPESNEPVINPWANAPILDPERELPEHATKSVDKKDEDMEDDEDHDPVKTHLEWIAPSRPFRRKDRSYFQTIAVIITLLILISLLAGEFMLVAVLLALSFVAYVMGLTPPTDISYRISNQGVTIGEHFYFWEYLDSFWLSTKEGIPVLHILTDLNFPAQLMLVLGTQDCEKVKRVVAKYLPYHEIAPKTLVDTWAQNLQRWFPLEKQTT